MSDARSSANNAQGYKPIHADIRKMLDEAADHLRGRCSMDGGDADDSADFIEELMDRHDRMADEIARLREVVKAAKRVAETADIYNDLHPALDNEAAVIHLRGVLAAMLPDEVTNRGPIAVNLRPGDAKRLDRIAEEVMTDLKVDQ